MKPLYPHNAALLLLLVAGACAHSPLTPVAAAPSGVARPDPVRVIADSARPARDLDSKPAHTKSSIDYASFDLPVQMNEQVDEYVTLYAERRRSTFVKQLAQMGRYRDYIEQRLDSLGMPRELVYIPLIESAYRADAGSPMGASGLWQFMKGTARSAGLEVSEYVDERRDPFASTDAALHHLQQLHKQFGSWYLTFAAYNSGSGRIERLLKERGLPRTDEAYWALRSELPKETGRYVPMLLGAVIVGEYASYFGLEPAPEPPLRFDLVSVAGGTSFEDIARMAQTTPAVIRELNPQFTKGITPPGRRSMVRVPPGSGAGLAAEVVVPQ